MKELFDSLKLKQFRIACTAHARTYADIQYHLTVDIETRRFSLQRDKTPLSFSFHIARLSLSLFLPVQSRLYLSFSLIHPMVKEIDSRSS